MIGSMPLTSYGLLPMEQQGGGLLGTSFSDPRTQAMISIASSLLQSGGPSLTPTSFGQALGRAGQVGLQSYNMGRQQALQNAVMKRQMARQDRQDAIAAEDRQRRISQEEAERQRQDQLREMFPSAFNEDGTVNPSSIQQIAAVSPGAAQALAGMLPKTAEPKYQVIEATLPDGRTIKGRVDLNAPNPEATFQPIGSAETKPIPAEASAKKAAIDQGISLVPRIRSLLFDDKGDFRESVVIDTPFVSTNPAKRELTPMILSAVEAVLRAESGAAVPEEEVRRAAQRYMPSPLDPDDVAKQKIDLLEDRLKRAQEAFEVGRPGSRTTNTMNDTGGWSIQPVE